MNSTGTNTTDQASAARGEATVPGIRKITSVTPLAVKSIPYKKDLFVYRCHESMETTSDHVTSCSLGNMFYPYDIRVKLTLLKTEEPLRSDLKIFARVVL